MEFRQSDALYRSFIGGIGAGKTWIGAYDLLRRSKPGCLYMACAPTYPMIRDVTLRSFLEIARSLDLLDSFSKADLTARIVTGAEVLFRSADDPERLRGPNLSGVWLDEASLMIREAFDITIGRLRQHGSQGWLSATMTPKGRQHWTYDVFSCGGPDVCLVHAPTASNPFLPPGFSETIQRQYTSAMAAQELGGEFVDLSGSLFQRGWFRIIDVAPSDLPTVRYWDMASTEVKKTRAGQESDPDWTAGVLVGKSPAGQYYIVDIQRFRSSPLQVEQRIKQTAEIDGTGVPIWMEQEPGSSGVSVIDHYTRTILPGWTFRGNRVTGDKATRAQPFAAMAEAGNVYIVRAEWNRAFLDEVETFPNGKHDDMVDAAAAGFEKLTTGTPWRRAEIWV